jgi:spore coat protein U-like protein
MKSKIILVFAAGSLIFFNATASHSQAADATTQMQVGATVSTTCTISAPTLDFGELSTETDTTASSIITASCSRNAAIPSFTVGSGGNPGGSLVRQMVSGGGDFIPYKLTVTAAADATNIADNGVIVLVSGEATIYGQVVPSDTYIDGNYTDSVLLTANYTF